MTTPSLRKLESDLGVNKTTLHNWKKTRPKLYEFIIGSYQDKELLKNHLKFVENQKKNIENELSLIKDRVV